MILAQLSDGGAVVVGFMGLVFLAFTVFFVAATAFWIWMLVDCLTKKRIPDNDKVVWVIVLLFTHLLGAVIYFLVVKSKPAGGS